MFKPANKFLAPRDIEEEDEDHGFEIVNMSDVPNFPEVNPSRRNASVPSTRSNNEARNLTPAIDPIQERALENLMTGHAETTTHQEIRYPDEEVLVDSSMLGQVPSDTYSTFVAEDQNSPMPSSQETLSQGTVYSLNEDNISLPMLPSYMDVDADSPPGSQTLSSGSLLMDMASAEMDLPSRGSRDQVAP